MRPVAIGLALLLLAVPSDAQPKKTPTRRPATTRKVPRPAPQVAPPVTRLPASIVCPSELGVGVSSARRFCDVLTGTSPREGIVVTIPEHQGAATLFFELHNRHTYSAELVRAKQAYRSYTATVGVLTMDNTLVSRAIIESEFRAEKDLYDRIDGGAGPRGVKAVAPLGAEFVQIQLPPAVLEVSILGEKLSVIRQDGTDLFSSAGRPVASVSNVMVEYRPMPPPRRPAKRNN